MKKLIVTLVAAAAFAVPAAAQAAPAHSCGVGGGGYVTASFHTSCPFAQGIINAWENGDCRSDTACSGHVYSPVTDETYEVRCDSYGHYPENWDCTAVGTPAWIKFTYRDA